MDQISLLRSLADKYNDEKYFTEDPISFPKHFAKLFSEGKCSIQDVEIAAVIAAHLAWGRRNMIVRDCKRAMDEMEWHPYRYVMAGHYKNDDISLHRTIKWSEFAAICSRLKGLYSNICSIESLTPDEMRVKIFGQKSDMKATNKKIHMLRRWMVRDDGKVDLGLWKTIGKENLIIPLDIHVFTSAKRLAITARNSPDYASALEITSYLSKVFPGDPALGDYALFAYAIDDKESFL